MTILKSFCDCGDLSATRHLKNVHIMIHNIFRHIEGFRINILLYLDVHHNLRLHYKNTLFNFNFLCIYLW